MIPGNRELRRTRTRMHRLRSVLSASALIALAALQAGCATPDYALRGSTETGDTPEGAELMIDIYRASDRPEASNQPEARIRSSLIPALTLVGDLVPGERGQTEIYLTTIELFANWANGWTEGRYEASGRLSLIATNAFDPGVESSSGRLMAPGRYVLRVEDPPKLWGVVAGEIRYYDSYYRGDDGVAKVRARVDRLQALAEFLREQPDSPEFYRHMRRGSPEHPSFREDSLPRLFPEPAGEELPEGPREIGSDIAWSVDYTEKNFPEQLRPLRNSGTMFRDYEEALELFYSFYNLEHVTTAMDGAVVRSE